MKTKRNGKGTVSRILTTFSFMIGAFALALPAPRAAADEAISQADQNCLGCHGSASMEKKLEDGGTLKLQVPAEPYGKSVHAANGCTSCHSDVNVAAHPPEKKEIKSARSFATEMTQVCRNCHADKFD